MIPSFVSLTIKKYFLIKNSAEVKARDIYVFLRLKLLASKKTRKSFILFNPKQISRKHGDL